MTLESALALAFATFIFACIPGPGVTALVAQALARGFGHGATWAVGLVMGDMVYLLMALFGMGWVAEQLGSGFVVFKWIGAAYLVYLGVRCWLAKPSGEASAVSEKGRARTFLGGMCVTLGNPKAIAFYCGFLPGFVDMQTLTASGMVSVVAVIIPTVLSVLVGYAWLASQGRNAVGSTRFWKIANRGAGTVMIGAGVAVVSK